VESGVKVVVIDRYLENVKAPQVICDDYTATRLATEHLISLGHRRIVHMAIPQTSYVGRQRSKGFHDAMSEAGIPVTSASTVDTPMGAQFGYQIMSRLLKRKNRPTAVVVRQDVIAIGAMRAILANGLSIPKDISIIGNGDFWCDDMLGVPLTTVHFPIEEVARIGVKRLLQMLAGEHVEAKTEVLDVKLIIRSSCAPVNPTEQHSD
jgi:DNA-binding LacI/PurR family transcriptional regulator